ncbi:hypothetical protein OAO87_02740 [bacterium]|nr:hypothetical protein [bacterium]
MDAIRGRCRSLCHTSTAARAVANDQPNLGPSRMACPGSMRAWPDMCAIFVPTPESEISPPKRGDNRQIEQVSGHGNASYWFLPFVRHNFGRHAEHARKRSPGTSSPANDIVCFAEAASTNGKITASPVYEFGLSTCVAGRIVVIGDAAHLATPMTAAGASALFSSARTALPSLSQQSCAVSLLSCAVSQLSCAVSLLSCGFTTEQCGFTAE